MFGPPHNAPLTLVVKYTFAKLTQGHKSIDFVLLDRYFSKNIQVSIRYITATRSYNCIWRHPDVSRKYKRVILEGHTQLHKHTYRQKRKPTSQKALPHLLQQFCHLDEIYALFVQVTFSCCFSEWTQTGSLLRYSVPQGASSHYHKIYIEYVTNHNEAPLLCYCYRDVRCIGFRRCRFHDLAELGRSDIVGSGEYGFGYTRLFVLIAEFPREFSIGTSGDETCTGTSRRGRWFIYEKYELRLCRHVVASCQAHQLRHIQFAHAWPLSNKPH